LLSTKQKMCLSEILYGTGTAHPSGAPEFTPAPGIWWVRVARSLVFSVLFCRSLFVLFVIFTFVQ